MANVGEVLKEVGYDEDKIKKALEEEKQGQNRPTLVSTLENRLKSVANEQEENVGDNETENVNEYSWENSSDDDENNENNASSDDDSDDASNEATAESQAKSDETPETSAQPGAEILPDASPISDEDEVETAETSGLNPTVDTTNPRSIMRRDGLGRLRQVRTYRTRE